MDYTSIFTSYFSDGLVIGAAAFVVLGVTAYFAYLVLRFLKSVV